MTIETTKVFFGQRPGRPSSAVFLSRASGRQLPNQQRTPLHSGGGGAGAQQAVQIHQLLARQFGESNHAAHASVSTYQRPSLGATVPGLGSPQVNLTVRHWDALSPRIREKWREVRLADGKRSGSPSEYAADATTAILQVATAQPRDLGLRFTTWSLPKLEESLRQRPALKHLARATIRRRLRAAGLRYRAGQTWCQSADPNFEVKKNKS